MRLKTANHQTSRRLSAATAAAEAKKPAATRPRGSRITIRLEKITYKKAKAYLKRTLKKAGGGKLAQRPLKRSLWQTYKQAMLNDQWMVTHQCVAFDWNGDLIDGQHRLWGVFESGKTVEMFVVRGLNPSVFQYIDSYQPRKATHLLCNLRPVLPDGTDMTPGAATRACNIARYMLTQGDDRKKITQLVQAEYAHLRFDLLHDIDNTLGRLDRQRSPVIVSSAFTNGALSSQRTEDVLNFAGIWHREEWRRPTDHDPLRVGKDVVRALSKKKGTDGRSHPIESIYLHVAGALQTALDGRSRKNALQLKGGFSFPAEEKEVRQRALNNVSIREAASTTPKLPPLNGKLLNMRSTKPAMRTLRITPALASRILKECRPLATETAEFAFGQGLPFHSVVAHIAERMLSEDKPWMTMHQGGLAFDRYGNLIDGKHVLHAIVQSQTTHVLFVTTGLDPEVFKVIDNGRRRNAADFLVCIRGKDSSVTAGAASRICKVARCMLAGTALKGRGGKFKDFHVAAYADKHFKLICEMDDLLGTISGHRAAGITAVFCNAAIAKNDVERAKSLASRFRSGVFGTGDPLRAAYEKIQKLWKAAADGDPLPDGKKTIQPDMFYRLLLGAIKAVFAGQSLKTCEESREDFMFTGTEKDNRCV